jgi:hypothetical protein
MAERWRLVILAALCAPGVVAAATLVLDDLTRPIFGSALTTWGFLGGLVGLAGFFSGFVSILAWPGVAFLTLKSVRSLGLGLVPRALAVVGCLVATYSAVFFVVWFIVIPITAAH